MLEALANGVIAGAALDVFDDEPAVPDALKALPNTVLTPHVAGQSPDAARDTVALVLKNLQAFFAGKPVLTPVTL
ncbi:putative 2-hydroxyacid dehydrogenase [compost metagenome]